MMRLRSGVRTSLAVIAFLEAGAARAEAPPADVPPEAVVGDVPFLKWPEMNRVALNLAPDGARAFKLVLDTGASDSVLTPQYARDLGVSIRAARERPYEIDTRLGRSLQFWVDTQSSTSRARTHFEYGLLGGTFLAEYVLEIDFAGRRVRFIDPEKYTVPKEVSAPDEAVLPLKVVGNRAILTVELEGKPVEVMFDTGAWDTLMISGRAAERAGFERPAIASMTVGGVIGSTQGQLVEAEKLAFGPFVYANVPMTVVPHGFYNQGPSSDSLIGYEVMRHFTVRLDYPRKRLWLRRVDEEPLTWFGIPWQTAKRVGILADVEEQGIKVLSVLPNTPAARLGIHEDDTIEFHGEGDTKAKLDALLAKIERGQKVTVARLEADDVIGDVELGGDGEPAKSP